MMRIENLAFLNVNFLDVCGQNGCQIAFLMPGFLSGGRKKTVTDLQIYWKMAFIEY